MAYENHRFNHNELDALGLVMGTALSAAPTALSSFEIRILRQQIEVLRVEGAIAPMKAMFAGQGEPNWGSLGSQLRISTVPPSAGEVAWLGQARNGSPLRVRLALSPGLESHVATSGGVFDYRLSLMPDLKVDLWKGATLNARWDVPLSWSENYRDSGWFGNRGTRTQLDRVMLQQAFSVAPGLMTQFGVGQYEPKLKGWMNETLWSPGEGRHRANA